MKSGLIITFLFFLSIVVHGQLIKLEPSNPAPRVGESFSISFTIERNNLDSMEVTNDKLGKVLVESMNQVGNGGIEISDWFLTDPGPLKIGPLQIPINNKVYLTDELNMIVNPRLPRDIAEGIWIRLLTFRGDEFVILEQRVPGKMKPGTNSTGRTIYSITTEGVRWAKLNLDKIQRKSIEIEEKRSQSSIQSTEIGQALYMIKVYKYKPLESFKGQFMIDKSLIDYLPDNGYLEIKRVEN